jgi:hypothetical protein
LLQILYWWHPLVWLANGRMRRVREEAVDDAVMVALREDAEMYAPTLLEVAKLALHRPLLSLGLVGIMESRSALRQRIERLMDFRAPRKAGLTVVSVLGVLAFSAVALPMGGAPGSADEQSNAMVNPVVASVGTKTNVEQVLITAHFYQVPRADFGNLMADLQGQAPAAGNEWWSATPEKFDALTRQLKSSGIPAISAPRMVTLSGQRAEIFVGNSTNGFSFDCTPTVHDGTVWLEVEGKLTRLEEGGVVTNRFRSSVAAGDHGGVVIRPSHGGESSTSNLVAVIGVQILSENSLYTRTYKLDPKRFPAALQREVGDSLKTAFPGQATRFDGAGTNVSSELGAMCKLIGVDLKSPPGKAIFYRDKSGVLLVKATQSDLDRVDKVIQEMVQEDPQMQLKLQMHLKARFYEVPKTGFSQFLNLSNSPEGGITGILTPDNARTTIQALEARQGTEILAEPEVVTTIGRQTQMRATQILTVVTGLTNEVVITNNSHVNNETVITEKVEFGPVLDFTTSVLADDYTISLDAHAALAEFFGYATAPKGMSPEWITNSFGEKINLPVILPAVRVKWSAARVKLHDNQTLVMSLNQSEQVSYGEQDTNRQAVVAKFIQDEEKKKKGEKEILVFLTATIIDQVGNRVHEDSDPLQDIVPPQN